MKISEFAYLIFSLVSIGYVAVFLEQRQIDLLLPLYVILSIGFFTLFILVRREGKLEVFDGGAILIAITALYSIYPLVSFAMNGFETTVLADNRLKENNMTASKMGFFAWNHVVYFASLSLSYLYFRPKERSLNFYEQTFKIINPVELIIGFIFMAALTVWSISIPLLFGDSFPYFIKQLNNNFGALFFVMSIWFFAVALTKWDNNFFKILLLIYLVFELIKLSLGMTGRTWVALHLIAFGMLYHKCIKPFSTKQIIIYSFAFIVVFLFFGFIRTGQASLLSVGVGFFTGNEEFTALFATAYDTHMLILNNETKVPFSVWSFDLTNLIPSQFLPYEKIAQTDWYVALKGLQDDGVGFGFGAITQGIIGFGKPDMMIRGILTGAFFGYLHSLVNRKNLSIWLLVLYVFLAIKGYHTFRSGTGYIIYFIIYQYLPCYLLIKFVLISANPNSRKLKFSRGYH